MKGASPFAIGYTGCVGNSLIRSSPVATGCTYSLASPVHFFFWSCLGSCCTNQPECMASAVLASLLGSPLYSRLSQVLISLASKRSWRAIARIIISEYAFCFKTWRETNVSRNAQRSLFRYDITVVTLGRILRPFLNDFYVLLCL